MNISICGDTMLYVPTCEDPEPTPECPEDIYGDVIYSATGVVEEVDGAVNTYIVAHPPSQWDRTQAPTIGLYEAPYYVGKCPIAMANLCYSQRRNAFEWWSEDSDLCYDEPLVRWNENGLFLQNIGGYYPLGKMFYTTVCDGGEYLSDCEECQWIE